MNDILQGYRDSAEGPYDIPLLLLPFALVSGVFGVLFCGVGIAVIALLKFFPVFCRGYVWMCNWFDRASELAKICCPCLLVAALGWPAFAVAGLAFVLPTGFVVGAWATVTYFAKGPGILPALLWSYTIVRGFDRATSKLAFGVEHTCLPDLERQRGSAQPSSTQPPLLPEPYQPPQHVPDTTGASAYASAPGNGEQFTPTAPPAGFTPVLSATPIPSPVPLNINAIWDSFFAACAIHTHQAVVEGLVSREEIDDQEPFLYIGIPALTIFRGFIVGGSCRS
jgi:hypothetical protein